MKRTEAEIYLKGRVLVKLHENLSVGRKVIRRDMHTDLSLYFLKEVGPKLRFASAYPDFQLSLRIRRERKKKLLETR